ncbi:MAG: glycine oxidase ThiO [Acidobacteria bacterium]|nr:glycine oxidase ThiO [Acidobacteriota bacterium]
MKVTIVGAGIVGAAIAYELGSRGARVCLVDGVGQGATQASAGVLAPYIEGHSSSLLRLGLGSLHQYDSFISRVSADAGRPVEYRRLGTLQVARTGDEVRQLKEAAAALAASSVSHACLDGDAARALEPALSGSVCGALRVPDQGYVGVASLMSALQAAIARQGATLSTARVTGIARRGGEVTVETGDDPGAADALSADAVIVAAGSWSGSISMSPAVSPPVRPVRGQLLQLRFPEPPFAHVIWGAAAYLVPWEDGSVLVGATVEDVGFDARVTVAGVRQLLDAAEALVPTTASVVLDGARAGLRPATPDQLPIIGPSSTMPGLYFATGHYRSGVLLAPVTSSMVADLVLDGRESADLALVRPDRTGL